MDTVIHSIRGYLSKYGFARLYGVSPRLLVSNSRSRRCGFRIAIAEEKVHSDLKSQMPFDRPLYAKAPMPASILGALPSIQRSRTRGFPWAPKR